MSRLDDELAKLAWGEPIVTTEQTSSAMKKFQSILVETASGEFQTDPQIITQGVVNGISQRAMYFSKEAQDDPKSWPHVLFTEMIMAFCLGVLAERERKSGPDVREVEC